MWWKIEIQSVDIKNFKLKIKWEFCRKCDG